MNSTRFKHRSNETSARVQTWTVAGQGQLGILFGDLSHAQDACHSTAMMMVSCFTQPSGSSCVQFHCAWKKSTLQSIRLQRTWSSMAAMGMDDDIVVFSSAPLRASRLASSASSRAQPADSGSKGSFDHHSDVSGFQFVVIVGQPCGRWSAELQGASKASKKTKQLLSDALAQDSDDRCVQLDSECIVGVGIAETWRLVRREAGHAQSYALMRAAMACSKKQKGQRFVEQRIVASAILAGGSRPTPPTWSHLSPPAIFRQFCQVIDPSSEFSVTSGTGIGETPSWASLLAKWSDAYQVSLDSGFAMVCWHKLARALALGKWYSDVVVLRRRRSAAVAGSSTVAGPFPGWPSRRRMWTFMADPLAAAEAIECPRVVRDEVKRTKMGFVNKYDPMHMVSVLSIGATLKSQRLVKLNVRRNTCFRRMVTGRTSLFAESDVDAHDSMVEQHVPSASALRRARVILDIAAMLWVRQWIADRKGATSFRYLSFDASPQNGWEMFATVERVVTQEQFLTASPEVISRRLPLTILNASKQKLQDKVMAHIHQVMLTYGTDLDILRKVNRDVRQCITDMGVELGVVDYPDVLQEFFRHPGSGVSSATRGHLYPLALAVPGPQHILDSILQQSLSAMSWWPEWQTRSKAVCQFVHQVRHRQQLQQQVEAAAKSRSESAADLQDLVNSLSNSCDKFAAWRWKTLASVTKALLRMQRALQLVGSFVQSPSELASKDAVNARTVFYAIKDTVFWEQVSCLSHLVGPFVEFSTWLRGCKCHERELRDGQEVTCPWKGCRAPELAPRVSKFMAQVADVRKLASSEGGQFGLLSGSTAQACSAMLAMAVVKFSWVNELPYLIWQAGVWSHTSVFAETCLRFVFAACRPRREAM